MVFLTRPIEFGVGCGTLGLSGTPAFTGEVLNIFSMFIVLVFLSLGVAPLYLLPIFFFLLGGLPFVF